MPRGFSSRPPSSTRSSDFIEGRRALRRGFSSSSSTKSTSSSDRPTLSRPPVEMTSESPLGFLRAAGLRFLAARFLGFGSSASSNVASNSSASSAGFLEAFAFRLTLFFLAALRFFGGADSSTRPSPKSSGSASAALRRLLALAVFLVAVLVGIKKGPRVGRGRRLGSANRGEPGGDAPRRPAGTEKFRCGDSVKVRPRKAGLGRAGGNPAAARRILEGVPATSGRGHNVRPARFLRPRRPSRVWTGRGQGPRAGRLNGVPRN